MFCGICGSKAPEDKEFCRICEQELSTSVSESAAVPVSLDELQTSAKEPIQTTTVEGGPPTGAASIEGAEGSGRRENHSYCRHSPNERTTLGVDRRPGSETCLGCNLPYVPGSPNSNAQAIAQPRYCSHDRYQQVFLETILVKGVKVCALCKLPHPPTGSTRSPHANTDPLPPLSTPESDTQRHALQSTRSYLPR